MQSFIKIGTVVFELSCGQTDRETDKQTYKRGARYNLLAEVISVRISFLYFL